MRILKTCVVVGLTALVLAAAAGAAAPAPTPDAHDRALAAQLNAKVNTFKQIAGSTSGSGSDTTLSKCSAFKKDPAQAFGALLLLIPVFLTQLVNDYGPQIRDLRATLGGMHPDSPLFSQWLAAEGQTMDLLLRFDNHGKKVDLCQAAKVLLDKKSTEADIYRTLGIHTALIGQLFGSTASTKLTKLNPQMRAFLIAAGLSAADAKTLTS